MEARSFNRRGRIDLQHALEVEAARLRRTFAGENTVEDIMRARALGEIADCLDTSALVRLSISIDASARHKDGRRQDSKVARKQGGLPAK